MLARSRHVCDRDPSRGFADYRSLLLTDHCRWERGLPSRDPPILSMEVGLAFLIHSRDAANVQLVRGPRGIRA